MAIIATLDPASLAVEPGAQAALTVRVRNNGAIVDRFDIGVVGPLAPWARVEPAALSLFPGQEGEAQITFGPPRDTTPRAGTYPYGVRIRAAADPTGAAVEEGRVTIAPFSLATAEIVPQTSRGSRHGRHEVLIDNRGNAPVDVTIVAADPDRLVDFEVRPDRVVIGPGERGGASVRAATRDTFFLGSKQNHPFNVEVRPGKDSPIPLRGTFVQGPILPTWLAPVAGILIVAIVAIIALPRITGGNGLGSLAGATSSPTPSPTPEPTPEPSPSGPSVPPSPSDGGGGASGSPGPTASPGPFELTVIGDPETAGGALGEKCPPEPADSACLQTARDTARALILSLGGPFEGRGIVATTNLSVENTYTLPVVIDRDVPFPWLAQGGTTTDETGSAVIDLAPLIAVEPGFAYAVVDSAAGPRRFVLPDQLARQLLETLYDLNPSMVDPGPMRSFPPFFEVYDPGILQFNFEFATPAP